MLKLYLVNIFKRQLNFYFFKYVFFKPLKNNILTNPKQFKINKIVAFNLFSFFGLSKSQLDPEDELIQVMKRGILMTQRKEYDKAEKILHVALRMAQNQSNKLAITYVYDLMANLAYERNENDKAKKLFVVVMQRLFQDQVQENDLKIIHIGMKLAHIAFKVGNLGNAELGYKWCLEKLATHSIQDDLNAMKLYGIVCDWYAQLLLRRNRNLEAIEYLKKALDICKQQTDYDNAQKEVVVMLLNDLGTAYWKIGNLNEAEDNLLFALEKSKSFEVELYLNVIKANLGLVYLNKNLIDKAQQLCKEAWKFSYHSKDENGLKQAQYCLDQIKNLGFFNNLKK